MQAARKNPAHKHTKDDGKYKHTRWISLYYMYLSETDDKANKPILFFMTV